MNELSQIFFYVRCYFDLKKTWYKHMLPSQAVHTCMLSGLDTLGRFSAIFEKGDNFYDFLFALQHTKALLKRHLL